MIPSPITLGVWMLSSIMAFSAAATDVTVAVAAALVALSIMWELFLAMGPA